MTRGEVAEDVEAVAAGPERRLLTWTVETGAGSPGSGDEAVDVIGDEPIWHDGEVVGWVTSGGYAHYSDESVAMGYVPAALDGEGSGFEIEIVGVRRPATPVAGCLWDQAGERMRS